MAGRAAAEAVSTSITGTLGAGISVADFTVAEMVAPIGGRDITGVRRTFSIAEPFSMPEGRVLMPGRAFLMDPTRMADIGGLDMAGVRFRTLAMASLTTTTATTIITTIST